MAFPLRANGVYKTGFALSKFVGRGLGMFALLLNIMSDNLC